ncbi:MAG: carbamoyltransferase HypF [Acidimicrobiia bacterium]|nr:carbamoyltransferase HypF [Acidimicrobiia bacterium]
MPATATPHVVIIGIGNPMRHDDGIGPAAVESLESSDLTGTGQGVELLTLDGEPTRLVEAWRDRRRAIVIDAACSGDPAGSIHRIDVGSDPLPPWTAAHSSHGTGLAEAVDLGRTLGLFPDHLVVFGIEAGDVSLGEGLSSEVRAALPSLIEQVTAEAMTVARRRLIVAGVVQGVGFRPSVHHLATELALTGFVRNEMTHVRIEIEGPLPSLEWFEERLRAESPPMARIDTIEAEEIPCRGESTFRIDASTSADRNGPVTLIPPDTAVCDDCLDELFDPGDRRYRYPFITCTNCGPRFTIIESLPYDRPNTTMRRFSLCEACDAEYHDPADRRHHAQPLACERCGPTVWHERARHITRGTDRALARVHHDLRDGRVVAIKGLGGYHLAVDATDDDAVARLRDRKARFDKPFAVMVPDLAVARRLAHIDEAGAAALESAARPVVLVPARDDSDLSSLVAPGNPLVGLMLPYTPLHHLLFRAVPGQETTVPGALVMTSGNMAGEPICSDDVDARIRLADLADSVLAHDRPIHVPCDDSVTRVIDGVESPIRRSRGFAPLPVRLPTTTPPVLAVGGEIKNTFALATGRTAWMSQHLGDMDNLETLDAFETSVELLSRLYRTEPELLAVDAHPGYRTRRWARDHADGHHMVEVQHHHAHLASLMAEHGLDGLEPVIGFVFDGTGYGTDGAGWGGEVLIGGYADVERWGHLAEVSLPGGDSAVRNPCRVALAHLSASGLEWSDDLPSVRTCDATELRVLSQQLTTGTHCARSTSMGRLFDAVASLLGLRQRITYEAQAAIELEMFADEATGPATELRFDVDPTGTIDATPILRDLVRGIRSGVDRRSLALGFHEAVVEVMATCAERVRRDRSLDVVGLTGGVFQNGLLTRLAASRLRAMGFRVLTHRIVPANDGGLALGQVMVAAHRATTTSRDRGAGPCA